MSNINFLETDAGKIYDELLMALENSLQGPLYPGDERRIFAEGIALYLAGVAVTLNDRMKQKMLRYARGDVLDALGENRGVYRIDPTPAVCTMEFFVEEPATANIIIPKGTTVTSDFDRFFATDTTVVLYTGQTSVSVSATSVGGGARFNGIAKGKINSISNTETVIGVDGCRNTDTTHSGGDAEEDDSLRMRIRTAENRHSTAGSESSYRFWAMSAHPMISDVKVISDTYKIERDCKYFDGHVFFGGADLIPGTLKVNGNPWTNYTFTECLLDIDVSSITDEDDYTDDTVHIELVRKMAGYVKIVPICYGGQLPDEDVLQDVRDVCSADTVRPMTDYVEVEAPQVVNYDIDLTYYCKKGIEADVIENIEGVSGAIAQYHNWQQSTFLPAINPDKLRQLILCPHDKDGNIIDGAYRVDIRKPEFTELSGTTIAKWSGIATIKHEVGKG